MLLLPPNEDKLLYLRFTGNVAFFANISGVNLQKEDHLITIMNDIVSSTLDLVDNMQLSDFLTPDEINAQQINKTLAVDIITQTITCEFFKRIIIWIYLKQLHKILIIN